MPTPTPLNGRDYPRQDDREMIVCESVTNRGCMTLDPTAALSLYDEAWAISDYESRLVSLRTFWADDGLYVDPDVPKGVRGPEALATEIERQLKLYPGMSIVSSAADVLGGRAWFRWSATLGTGESFNGVDFVEFAPDGRIARLTGFYEP